MEITLLIVEDGDTVGNLSSEKKHDFVVLLYIADFVPEYVPELGIMLSKQFVWIDM